MGLKKKWEPSLATSLLVFNPKQRRSHRKTLRELFTDKSQKAKEWKEWIRNNNNKKKALNQSLACHLPSSIFPRLVT